MVIGSKHLSPTYFDAFYPRFDHGDTSSVSPHDERHHANSLDGKGFSSRSEESPPRRRRRIIFVHQSLTSLSSIIDSSSATHPHWASSWTLPALLSTEPPLYSEAETGKICMHPVKLCPSAGMRPKACPLNRAGSPWGTPLSGTIAEKTIRPARRGLQYC